MMVPIPLFRPLLGAVAAAAVLFATALAASAHEHREVGDFSYVVGWLEEPAFEGIPNAVSIRVSGPVKVAHGGLFEGGALEPGEEFSFTFGPEFTDSEVPFHNHIHPELGGSVAVTEDAPEGDVEIDATSTGFSPANVLVHPGFTVTWRNAGDSSFMVHSGEGVAAEHDGEESEGHEGGSEPLAPIDGLDGALRVEITHLPTGATRSETLVARFRDPGHYIARVIPTAPGAYTFHLTGEIEGVGVDELFESGPETFDDVQTQAGLQFPVQVAAPREIEGAARGAQDAVTVAQRAADDAGSDASSAQTLAIIAIVVGVAGLAVGAGGLVVGSRRR